LYKLHAFDLYLNEISIFSKKKKIVGENFQKKRKQVRETIKRTWEENFVKDSGRKKQAWEKM
jgi:hypothetical protein